MIRLESHDRGSILPVRALPGAQRDEIRGEQDGSMKIAVTQVAEKGKANKAIQKLLAKRLGIAKSQLELVAGESSSNKKFLVIDLNVEQLREELSRLIATGNRPAKTFRDN